MPISLSARLRQFAQTPLLSNPAVAQSTLARAAETTRSPAAGFGAGFLAPAVDAANDQARQFDFLIKLEQLRQQRESSALNASRAATSDLVNQAKLAQLLRENDPAVIKAQREREDQEAKDLSASRQAITQGRITQNEIDAKNAALVKSISEIIEQARLRESGLTSSNTGASASPQLPPTISQSTNPFVLSQSDIELLQNNGVDPSNITSQEALQNALDSIGNGTGNLDPSIDSDPNDLFNSQLRSEVFTN